LFVGLVRYLVDFSFAYMGILSWPAAFLENKLKGAALTYWTAPDYRRDELDFEDDGRRLRMRHDANNEVAMKLIFMILRGISKRWTMPIRNWGETMQRFSIIYGDRAPL